MRLRFTLLSALLVATLVFAAPMARAQQRAAAEPPSSSSPPPALSPSSAPPEAGSPASLAPSSAAPVSATTSAPSANGVEPREASTAPAAAAASGAPTSRRASSEPETGTLIHFGIPGEWQLRLIALSPIPLLPTPGQIGPSTLGQQFYFEQWFRFGPEFHFGDHLRLVSQFDVARGILLGDTTHQVELSRDNRDTNPPEGPFPHGAVDVRWVFLEWNSPIGILRVGQQGSHWGLGIVANDGNRRPIFGDYRLGDIVERIAFATRPGGRSSDIVTAIAGDLVYRDQFASLMEYQVPAYDGTMSRTLGGDMVWQAIAAVFWQDHLCRVDCERKRLGVYLVYRDWTNRDRPGDYLRAGVADVYGRWEWPTPDGRARAFAALELVGIYGRTNFAQTVDTQSHEVLQYGGATEIGIERDQHFHITLAAGYASGDANALDGSQHRLTFNPDYRVGLIMFPELWAWVTARSASIAVDASLMHRPAHGADLLPTSGGVANAMYFNPTAIVNLGQWLDARLGVVVGQSTTDVVDPVRLILFGTPQNYYGGNSHARDLGLEIDGGLMGRYPLATGLFLNGGLQGGVMFPGHAFDDAMGHGPGVLWLVRGMAGLQYD